MNRSDARSIVWRVGSRACAAAICLVMLSACDKHPANAADQPVVVLAASSTGDAVAEVGRAYEEQTGIEVRVSAAGSNAMAQQIAAGAPGDLFLSADGTWADEVMNKGAGTEKLDLLGNELVLIVPTENPGRLRSPHDLAQGRVKRIALAGEAVPAGRYAEQALRSMGMWGPALPKVVRGENVRFALAYVERAEAEAGVVYATDAAASSRVMVVFSFPASTHDPIVYPIVMLKHGADREAVRGLWEFMLGPDAAAIFERHGFRMIHADGGDAGSDVP